MNENIPFASEINAEFTSPDLKILSTYNKVSSEKMKTTYAHDGGRKTNNRNRRESHQQRSEEKSVKQGDEPICYLRPLWAILRAVNSTETR